MTAAEADLQTPYLHTVWCDDVRHELGNKLSLMGIYTGEMLLPSLPAVLGKLVCHNVLVVPIAHPVQLVRLKLLKDDVVLGEQVLEQRDPAQAEAEARTLSGHPATRRQVSISMLLQPLELPAGTRVLQVVAEVDGVAVPGNKLWVSVAAADGGPAGEKGLSTPQPRPPEADLFG